MQQVIIGGTGSALNTTSARNLAVQGGGALQSGTNGISQIVSVAGVFSSLRIRLSAAPGASKSYTFRLVVNGANTSIVVVVSGTDTTGIDSTHTATVAAGDYIWISCTPSGTPTAANPSHAITFTGDYALIMGAPRNGTGIYDTNYVACMCAQEFVNASEGAHRQVIPTAGKLGNLYVKTHIALSSSETLVFTLRVNGVDSTLTCTIPNSGQTANDTTHTVTVAAGDIVTLKIVGTPSGAGRPSVYIMWGMSFEPDIPGESIVMNNPTGNMHTSSVVYNYPCAASQVAWTGTELTFYQLAQLCKIGKFHVLLSGEPGTDNSYTLTIRDDATDTSVTVTISGSDTTGSDTTHTIVVAAGSVLTIKSNPNATTPTARVAYWGFVMNPVVLYPSDSVARVSSIRHICRPGFYRMQVGLGDLGFDIDVAEATVREALDTVKEAEPPPPRREPQLPGRLPPRAGIIEPEPSGPRPPEKTAMEKLVDIAIQQQEQQEIEYPGPTAKITAPQPRAPKIRTEPSLWQRITPWKEEAGETFGSEIAERLKSFKGWVGGLFK